MKKIYSILTLLVLAVAANAQRNITVLVGIVKPAVDTNVTTTSTQNPIYLFQNKSATDADSIMVGDTIMYVVPGSPFSGSSYTGYEYIVMTQTLKKDSIMAVNGVPTPFAKIEGLYNSSKTLVGKPFTNNTQYWWYLRPIGVSAKSGTTKPIASFTPGTADTQRIWINKGTGMVEFANNKIESLTTYPNPATTQLSFEYNFDQQADAQVKVTDVTGRVVISKDYNNQVGRQKFDLDINALSNGAYILQMIINDKTLMSKFNVQK